MRILHLDPDDMDNPLSGGGPVRTFEIYRRLARRHEVTVLTPTFPGSTPELVREGVRYRRLGRRVGKHGSSHHITFLLGLPRAVRAHDYDLLVEDFMPPAAVTPTPLFAKAPVIASVQWFYVAEWAKRYRLPFHLVANYGIRLYRHFVVLSEAMREHVQLFRPRAHCAVIPNAVDGSLFELEPAAGDFILYLGLVDFEQKGVDLMLRGYASLPQSLRLPLVIAGHGHAWEPVRALVNELALEGWVRMPGKVDRAERARLFRGCRFVCVPSRIETFGMVILEACAAGKRVVVFDRAPMNEVAPRGPSVFAEPFSAESYARGMRRLLEAENDEMTREGARAREWARGFSWDRTAERQERFYEEVLASEAGR